MLKFNNFLSVIIAFNVGKEQMFNFVITFSGNVKKAV